MPPQYECDEGWNNPYSQQTPPRSESISSHTPKIVIEPTERTQEIYNQIRKEQNRLNLHSHVTSQTNDDLLNVPNAPGMVRSPTVESCTSSIYSGPEDLLASATQESSVAENSQGRRPRGRRHRPLDAETRLHTALKRKLKLTCEKHRQKKTTVSRLLEHNIDQKILLSLLSAIVMILASWKKATAGVPLLVLVGPVHRRAGPRRIWCRGIRIPSPSLRNIKSSVSATGL